AALEPAVRHLLDVHPADAWARRELALTLAQTGRFDEAFRELDLARDLEPASTSYFSVRGQVCDQAGRRAEAAAAFRAAVRLSVDNDYAIGRLLDCCDTLAARRDALHFVEAELVRQVTVGDGLLAYQYHARRAFEPDEVLALVQKALDARPDLWHAWSAVVRVLADVGRLDEADARVREATTRFPLLPRLWLDRATVCKRRGDRDGQEAALRQAGQINPSWGPAVRELATVCNETGRFDEAKALLEQAFVRTPLDAVNHGWLADLHWRRGETDAALTQLHQALLLEPGYTWAWD